MSLHRGLHRIHLGNYGFHFYDTARNFRGRIKRRWNLNSPKHMANGKRIWGKTPLIQRAIELEEKPPRVSLWSRFVKWFQHLVGVEVVG